MLTHNLGYPRIGAHRELKTACERYWSGEGDLEEVMQTGEKLRRAHWLVQKEAGLDLIPCNDFSYYDQVLDLTLAVGAVPPRYQQLAEGPELDLYFAMARGYQQDGVDIIAMEMTKWFDTNYHYLVPEFARAQQFSLTGTKAVGELIEAKGLGIEAKPVLTGPVSYLLLGKEKEPGFHRLELLPRLLPVYIALLNELMTAGARFIQLDEPFLALDIDDQAREAYRSAYSRIAEALPELKIVLATYFDGLRENASLAINLPVHALHLDLVRAPDQLDRLLAEIPSSLTLSLGLVDGRNIWKSDLGRAVAAAERAVRALGTERVWVAPSCSLLHAPYDCALEASNSALPPELRDWFAFARQKVAEVAEIASLTNSGSAEKTARLEENRRELDERRRSPLIHDPQVKERLKGVSAADLKRKAPFHERREKQQQALKLPIFPTTTIGSFPQTAEVRRVRSQLTQGKLSEEQYQQAMKREIEKAIRLQEEIGLDVLVHGEFERNDMVQYFGEQLEGCCFTQNGWVQSFGSRCVRPPVIFGDVRRKAPMTVGWSSFANSLTDKPVKGMLTGPVTILQWSFVRDDQPRRETALQIALAIRDEVADLERAGIEVIQIDEPAFREGLPLRQRDRREYLDWAVDAFRLATSCVRDETQVHTHMCYSEFNDIIAEIAALDADVITIETSRSQMELLEAFKGFSYPNDIGPGVYDIHSPRIPACQEMYDLLERALEFVPRERLWVNPDCGLKTRGWTETKEALANMVYAARNLREMGR
ncbi:5-methyltetrahydropteroyltriglutamate--homocysteine S-methyltransferase [Geomonas sp.]|uniref:5-methyltetrahydropteroyltriglutamate-- homocysteine S-methyltransferase n=1 Tax=Geomonas sp. TaxID=2651584 RepID=UPI002B47B701|nr:5-methyltetrahydropteroyltriglutamate--homocysteine S-methyltransferase [Geomonas sp.]HJV36053.1 5-methyltetrahydropteroyltriglutamate--homocysteine S-methyltransferase [Geomonas sp.]